MYGARVVEIVGGVEPRELDLLGVNSAAQAINLTRTRYLPEAQTGELGEQDQCPKGELKETYPSSG